MPEITSRPQEDPGRPAPKGSDRTRRSAWHRKASAPVSVWLVALLAVVIGGHWIPQQRWLLVHMVTLGVATTSILAGRAP